MRPSLCICILSLIATSLATPLTTTEETAQRFNPDMTEIHALRVKSPGLGISQLEGSRLTNAMRLTMGYPLKPPHRRTAIHNPRFAQNNTTTIKGYLEVIDSENHQTLGHISKTYNYFGEYGVLTSNITDYLLVSLDMVLAGGTLRNAIISTINGPLAAYPFLGTITGFNSMSDDLKEGYYNYAVFGGTANQLTSRPIQGGNSFAHFTGIHKSLETAIFSYSPSSGEIECHWVNEDGSKPTTFIGFNSQEAALFITGDKSSFTNKYGSNSIHWVTLKLHLKINGSL